VGLRAGLDSCGKFRSHRDSIPGPSSPQAVAIPTSYLCYSYKSHHDATEAVMKGRVVTSQIRNYYNLKTNITENNSVLICCSLLNFMCQLTDYKIPLFLWSLLKITE
jgi:hypothetical protein